MQRPTTITTCAVLTVLAAALGLLAWRADAPTVSKTASLSAPPTTVSPVVSTTTAATALPPDTAPTSTGEPATTAAAAPEPTGAVAVAGSTVAVAGSMVAVAGPADACPGEGHGAVVDRASQRAWLCDAATIVAEMPITSAWSMPDPGTYPVYAKDLQAWSTFGGHASTMTHFVAFSRGERTRARIAFHSVPKLRDGSFVQPLASVGDLGERGESSGCIRLVPDDAVRVWDWLAPGDQVHVIS